MEGAHESVQPDLGARTGRGSAFGAFSWVTLGIGTLALPIAPGWGAGLSVLGALCLAGSAFQNVRRLQQEAVQARSRISELSQMESDLRQVQTQISDYESKLAKALEETTAANEIIRHASQRFQELFEGLPVACFTTDASGTLFEWNRAALELFDLRPERIYLQRASDVLPVEGHRDALDSACAKAAAGTRVLNVEWTAKSGGGDDINVLCNVFPIRSPHGDITGIVYACNDVTEQRKSDDLLKERLETIGLMNGQLEAQKRELESANVQLAALAATDGLTGLHNHRSFQTSLKSALSQAGTSFVSVILIDVDWFKQFNDRYGHPAGDEVLKGVAQILQGACTNDRIAARYGGEEFVVLAPGLSEAEAAEMAEELRIRVAAWSAPNQPVTASFGVATAASGTCPAVLVSAADNALYLAKAHGRNRVCTASSAVRAAA